MTERYTLWRQALIDRDHGIYSLLALSLMFVVSYLVTYAPWVPARWGKYIRFAYEVGGALMFAGMVVVSAV